MSSPSRKRAKITKSEAIREISKRTGLNVNDVFRVLFCFGDIIRECIENEAEVEFIDVCKFTFRRMTERRFVQYYNPLLKKVVSYDFLPAYRKPCTRFTKKFLNELKKSTAEPMSEETKKMLKANGYRENTRR